MKTFQLFSFFLISTVVIGCNQSKSYSKKVDKKIAFDASKSFKVDSFYITPKTFFEYNSVLQSRGDTLDLVGCGDYIYSPFGPINNKTDFPTSRLKKFSIYTQQDKGPEHYVYQILKYKASTLKFFFYNDSEASRASFLTDGEILNPDVSFISEVKIGMSQAAFVEIFFDSFPNELIGKFKVIAFESCVESIRHIYTFESGSLKSVKFISV